jgi:hypothetical protein
MVLLQLLHLRKGDLERLVGLSDRRFCLCCQSRSLGCLRVGYLLLRRHYYLHLLGCGLVDCQLLHQFLCFDGGLFQLGLHLGESFLHFFDGVVGVQQFVETVLEAADG